MIGQAQECEFQDRVVVADTGYGQNHLFRDELTQRGLDYLVSVRGDVNAHLGKALPGLSAAFLSPERVWARHWFVRGSRPGRTASVIASIASDRLTRFPATGSATAPGLRAHHGVPQTKRRDTQGTAVVGSGLTSPLPFCLQTRVVPLSFRS